MRDYVRLGGILFIITASVALVLSIGNHATKERQKALTDETANKARLEVISSAEVVLEDTAETMEYSKEGSSVKSVTSYKKSDGSHIYAVFCTPKGYGGEISMMVGVDDKLTVTDISITDSTKETPGLGSRVGDTAFLSQFAGKGKNIGINKNQPEGNEIQAVTGATISSKAVVKGTNDAIDAVEEVMGR